MSAFQDIIQKKKEQLENKKKEKADSNYIADRIEKIKAKTAEDFTADDYYFLYKHCDKHKQAIKKSFYLNTREQFLKNSNLCELIKDYRKIRFSSIDREKYCKHDKENFDKLKEFTSNYDDKNKKWLYLNGDVGNGKTTMASAVLNGIIDYYVKKEWYDENNNRRGMWIRQNKDKYLPVYALDVNSTLTAIRASYGEKKSMLESEIDGKCKRAKVLLLDDIFAERATPWALEKLHSWIGYRYNTDKTTIFTSNIRFSDLFLDEYTKDIEKFSQRQFKRITSRINEKCRENRIFFEGNDFRIKGGGLFEEQE